MVVGEEDSSQIRREERVLFFFCFSQGKIAILAYSRVSPAGLRNHDYYFMFLE